MFRQILLGRATVSGRGQEAQGGAAQGGAAASPAAGDANGWAGRGGGAAPLPEAFLARARDRRPDRHLQWAAAGAGRPGQGDRQPRRRLAARHPHLRLSRGDRRRTAGAAAKDRNRLLRRLAHLPAVPGARPAVHLPCGRLARARRPLRPGGDHRGAWLRRVAAARLSARPGRLRPLARLDGDAGNHLLPEHAGDGRGDQCRQRPGRRYRAAPGGGGPLAGRRARVEPALLRPGSAVRVGPPTQEEPRCRPTSCSRA
jgi:hypothetical protein